MVCVPHASLACCLASLRAPPSPQSPLPLVSPACRLAPLRAPPSPQPPLPLVSPAHSTSHKTSLHARIPRTSCSCADLAIRGTLHSVDQYLNIKLLGVSVEDTANFPHLQSVKNCFIRGSVIKYVQLPASEVDTELLQDAARREAVQQKGGT